MLKLETKPFAVAVEHGEEQFTLHMTPITSAELARELRREEAKTNKAVGARMDEALDTVRAHVTGWEGVGNAKGKPLPFTPEALEMLLSEPERLWAVYRSWLSARQERSRGN